MLHLVRRSCCACRQGNVRLLLLEKVYTQSFKSFMLRKNTTIIWAGQGWRSNNFWLPYHHGQERSSEAAAGPAAYVAGCGTDVHLEGCYVNLPVPTKVQPLSWCYCCCSAMSLLLIALLVGYCLQSIRPGLFSHQSSSASVNTCHCACKRHLYLYAVRAMTGATRTCWQVPHPGT